jgi:hypothetical protein
MKPLRKLFNEAGRRYDTVDQIYDSNDRLALPLTG